MANSGKPFGVRRQAKRDAALDWLGHNAPGFHWARLTKAVSRFAEVKPLRDLESKMM